MQGNGRALFSPIGLLMLLFPHSIGTQTTDFHIHIFLCVQPAIEGKSVSLYVAIKFYELGVEAMFIVFLTRNCSGAAWQLAAIQHTHLL